MPAQNGTEICRCGSRGCLETVASARAIAGQLSASRGEPVSTQKLLELTANRNPAASRLIAEAGREIGVALAGLVNLVNPDCVIIGGDLSAAAELITEPVLESIRRYALASAAEQVTVVPGVLGERAELLGALALVLHAGDGLLATQGSPQEVAA
jgi:predicted NBD/HSP70 family sugar kinase